MPVILLASWGAMETKKSMNLLDISAGYVVVLLLISNFYIIFEKLIF